MPQHQPVPMAAAASARSGAPSILNSSGTSATDCPICCTLFRTPKCLACGHSICSSCCQKLLRNDTMIRCPTCRHVTRAAPEGLPTNYALQVSKSDVPIFGIVYLFCLGHRESVGRCSLVARFKTLQMRGMLPFVHCGRRVALQTSGMPAKQSVHRDSSMLTLRHRSSR